MRWKKLISISSFALLSTGSALLFSAVLLQGQLQVLNPFGTPMTPQVSGRKTADGLRLTSQRAAIPFSLTLAGVEIKPLDTDRLLWDVDGLKLELTYADRNLAPAPSSDAEQLEQFRAARSAGRKRAGSSEKAAERFACASGRTCLLWNEEEGPSTLTWIVAATDGKLLLLLQAPAAPFKDSERVRDYLMRSFQTLEFGAVAARARPDPGQVGLDLSQQLDLYHKMFAVPFTALLNQRFSTPKDAALSITLNSTSLIAFLELMLAANGTGRKVMGATVNVFDGTAGHVITVEAFDSRSRRFYYRDTLGNRSFLQKENNRANVNAQPVPATPRLWVVNEDELERVLNSVVFPATNVYGLLRLCTLLAGEPDKAVLTYLDLQVQDRLLAASRVNGRAGWTPQAETQDDRLLRIQRYLESVGSLDQAAVVFRIRSALGHHTDPEHHTGQDAASFEQALLAAHRDDLVAALRSAPPERILPALPLIEMEKAGSSEFFRWFHWQSVAGEGGKDGVSVASFKPSGPTFRDLVDMKVTLEGAYARSWTLLIDRSFLNSKDQAPFAADLAKSFLAFTVPGATAGAVKDLENEIETWWRSERKSVPVAGAGPSTKVPVMPSAPYMVYLGYPGTYVQPLRIGRLSIGDVQQNNKGRLQITVERVAVPEVATVLHDLGDWYFDAGREADAESAYRDAIKTYRDSSVASSTEYAGDMAASLDSLGSLYHQTGRLKEAESAHTEALGIYQRLAANNADYRGDLAEVLANLGGLYQDLRKPDQAKDRLTEALRIYRGLAETESNYLTDIVTTLSSLGRLYQSEGLKSEAASACTEAVAIYTRITGSRPGHAAAPPVRPDRLFCFR